MVPHQVPLRPHRVPVPATGHTHRLAGQSSLSSYRYARCILLDQCVYVALDTCACIMYRRMSLPGPQVELCRGHPLCVSTYAWTSLIPVFTIIQLSLLCCVLPGPEVELRRGHVLRHSGVLEARVAPPHTNHSTGGSSSGSRRGRRGLCAVPAGGGCERGRRGQGGRGQAEGTDRGR